MPLKESINRNNLDFDSDYSSSRKRRRRDSTERDRSNNNHRSRSRSRHRDRCTSPRSNNDTPRRHRRYRGSSGTRTSRRSYDRSIRLRQYYIKKKQHENGYQCEQQRSRDGYTHRHHENNTCDSVRTSRSSRSSSNNHSVHSSSASIVRDDEDGHLIYRAGDWLQNRYEVLGLLGEGTFGKCLECYDRKHKRVIALKVIKNIEKYREAAKLEIKVLDKLAKKDPDNKNLCIQLLSAFDYHGHVCLSFQKLGKSVFDFMKENMYQPYTMPQVQHIAQQLLTSVRFLHNNKLTHTDLKPENMLFVNSDYDSFWSDNARQDIHVLRKSDVRLIDFGSATFDHEHHSTVVSTRHYRAPEVVLELGWSQPCDMWSCGCIIFELYTGNTLFQTHDNREHLAMMEHTLGKLPSSMIKKSKKTKYFKKDVLDWDVNSSEGRYVKGNCERFKDHRTSDRSIHIELFDLLEKTLIYSVEERITADEALNHPFFNSMEINSTRRREENSV